MGKASAPQAHLPSNTVSQVGVSAIFPLDFKGRMSTTIKGLRSRLTMPWPWERARERRLNGMSGLREALVPAHGARRASHRRSALAAKPDRDTGLDASDDKSAATRVASDHQPPPPAGPPRKSRRAWAPAVLAGAIVLGLWGPNLVRPPPPAWTTYVSLKGQTRRIKLGDQSLLRMNGATSIKVVFEDRLRRAVFEGGEAEFVVAANGRPFQMSVGDRDLRTRYADFNLRRYGQVGAVKATLTVRRGQVDVGDLRGKDNPRILSPGDQMTWIEGQAASATKNIDPNLAFDWENHRLVYDHAPLSDVVIDLNRYVDRPISISPTALGTLPFTGVLTLDSEDRMLDRLREALPIQAQTLRAAIVLKPRPDPRRARIDPRIGRKPSAAVRGQ